MRWILALTLKPSVMTKLMVRCVVLGTAAMSVNRMERSADCHCASVAEPLLEVSTSTPDE